MMNEVLAVSNKDFSLFTLEPETWQMLNNFPPLISPFGQYRVQNSANILCYQKIGSVTTEQPLILFNHTGELKNGLITGEGIWRWELADFDQKNNFSAFNEIINKTIQYLSVKEDKSFFKVHCKNHFFENEAVEFDAEVYNDSYELINDPDVEMTIINSEGKKFPYVFSKVRNTYHLELGVLPVGIYNFVAKTKSGQKILEKKGEFSILPLNVESTNTIANHELLNNLSKQHDGEMFYPKQFSELLEKIKKRSDIRSVDYFQKRYNDLVNLPFIFFIIMVLLSVEWFLRKNHGGY
jgi:hypothetical protein